MAIIFANKDRHVIPNWRDFKRTLSLGELRTIRPGPHFHLQIDVERPKIDWNIRQNVAVAADLINTAFIAGKNDFKELEEAVDYVSTHESQTPKALLEIAKSLRVLRNAHSGSEHSNSHLEVETFEEFLSYTDKKIINKLIHRTKNLTRVQLLNPIPWVELSRLYSFVAQKEKAERVMQIALGLAPDNRFVLRSATRLYAHFQAFDKALYYLRRSEATKEDPWLISAHIAASAACERFSPLIKPGMSIIESNKFSNYDITELASALSTLELKNGNIKKAKKFFQKSLGQPNDNSLAQLEWISQSDGRFNFDPLSFDNVTNHFEAFALENFERGFFKESLQNCVNWFLDIPYSKEPALLGSYIAGTFRKDFTLARLLCEAGLKSNPNDPLLLNNMIYNYALANEFEKADPYIESFRRIKFEALPREMQLILQATYGLIAFRNGQTELGKKLYNLSITIAKKIQNDELRDLATVNFTRELILSKCPITNVETNQLIDIIAKTPYTHIKALGQQVLELYSHAT
jgi:hypothetical protein